MVKHNFLSFLRAYMPLIGQKINDQYFKTDKLTKTAILNKIIELFFENDLSILYRMAEGQRHMYFKILEQLELLLNLAKELGIEPKKEYKQLNCFAHTIGNSKIGNDTLIISFSSALLCPMALTDNCNNCGICYAKNSNKMYSNEFINGILNQIVLLRILLGYVPLFEVLDNTIHSIIANYSKPQLFNLKFLRLNVQGDILDNNHLKVIEAIAMPIVTVFNLLCCYSYTHNKELNIEASSIVFNTSDFVKHGCKSCITYYYFSIDLLEKEGHILCNGNCNGCPYCKSKFEARKVMFLAHGGKFEGVEQIPSEFMAYLEYNKQSDYLLFLRQLAEV